MDGDLCHQPGTKPQRRFNTPRDIVGWLVRDGWTFVRSEAHGERTHYRKGDKGRAVVFPAGGFWYWQQESAP